MQIGNANSSEVSNRLWGSKQIGQRTVLGISIVLNWPIQGAMFFPDELCNTIWDQFLEHKSFFKTERAQNHK